MNFHQVSIGAGFKTLLRRYFFPVLFQGNRPDFMIVGAQKSGTTSLFNYLDRVPGISGSHPKEVHFFDREDNYSKGFGWYEKHFIIPSRESTLYFEASPTYLFRDNVAERLKLYNPNMKIIILLREPVARAYSAWNMYRQWSAEGFIPSRMKRDLRSGFEPPLFKTFYKKGCPSFSDYIRIEMDLIKKGDIENEPSLIRRGLYKSQIERFFEIFERDNVLIFGFNDLKYKSSEVVRECVSFLGVPHPGLADSETGIIKNKRNYPSAMCKEDAEFLNKFYSKPNEDLFDLLGFRPDW